MQKEKIKKHLYYLVQVVIIIICPIFYGLLFFNYQSYIFFINTTNAYYFYGEIGGLSLRFFLIPIIFFYIFSLFIELICYFLKKNVQNLILVVFPFLIIANDYKSIVYVDPLYWISIITISALLSLQYFAIFNRHYPVAINRIILLCKVIAVIISVLLLIRIIFPKVNSEIVVKYSPTMMTGLCGGEEMDFCLNEIDAGCKFMEYKCYDHNKQKVGNIKYFGETWDSIDCLYYCPIINKIKY